MATLNEVIESLTQIREETGGDIDISLSLHAGYEPGRWLKVESAAGPAAAWGGFTVTLHTAKKLKGSERNGDGGAS